MQPTILVIGAGTAGTAAAIFLRQKGLAVVLADRLPKPAANAAPRVGESLPPDGRSLLQELGLWEAFEAGPHLPCYGNKSYWHSSTPQYHDFLQNPAGHGWHLDRTAFDRMLLDNAIALGADYRPETNIQALKQTETGWHVRLQNAQGELEELQAAICIDASGRNHWLARQLGVERYYEDDQLALVTFYTTRPEFDDSVSLTETTDRGWWYSALIPGNRMATAFFCHPDKTERKAWLQPEALPELLAQAPHTRERLQQAEARGLHAPRFVSADSGILESLAGQHWLAIGDAAFSYDPIASHGIMMAMVTARDAAQAIEQRLNGQHDAFEHYNALFWHAFQRYAQQRQQFYA